MLRRLFIATCLLLASSLAFAQLTTEQKTTLKAAMLADPALTTFVAQRRDDLIADYYNAPSNPAFTVWRTNVTANETGNAWVGTDIDGMAALNMQRLQLLLASSPSGIFDMSRADRRAGFENPFGTNANNASRVAMRAVWKRIANRVERLFATGTGSDATPGLLGSFEGRVTVSDISALLN
jgi:hypothetical protein